LSTADNKAIVQYQEDADATLRAPKVQKPVLFTNGELHKVMTEEADKKAFLKKIDQGKKNFKVLYAKDFSKIVQTF
jgi:hypothetical protein